LHFTDINRSSPELPALNTRYNQRPNHQEKHLYDFSLKLSGSSLRRLPSPTNPQQNCFEQGEKEQPQSPKDWSVGSRGSVGFLRG
jgi:hypothetical protein